MTIEEQSIDLELATIDDIQDELARRSTAQAPSKFMFFTFTKDEFIITSCHLSIEDLFCVQYGINAMLEDAITKAKEEGE